MAYHFKKSVKGTKDQRTEINQATTTPQTHSYLQTFFSFHCIAVARCGVRFCGVKVRMRVLTLNSLKSPLKSVNLGYPMGVEIQEMEV